MIRHLIKKTGYIALLWLPMLSIAQKPLPAITQPIPLLELQELHNYSEATQHLILKAHRLTQLNLTYLFGSADPSRHGMDCSGAIYYLLNQFGIDVPRSANEIYLWVKQKGKFYAANSDNCQSSEFSHLRPGDLLFWSGTYRTHKKNTITHVMIYLGKNHQNHPLMFGSSDGRTYQGKRMWGVSVFDFKLPAPGSTSHFVGYSCVPKLNC